MYLSLNIWIYTQSRFLYTKGTGDNNFELNMFEKKKNHSYLTEKE